MLGDHPSETTNPSSSANISPVIVKQTTKFAPTESKASPKSEKNKPQDLQKDSIENQSKAQTASDEKQSPCEVEEKMEDRKEVRGRGKHNRSMYYSNLEKIMDPSSKLNQSLAHESSSTLKIDEVKESIDMAEMLAV